jgi:hypothetical protein
MGGWVEIACFAIGVSSAFNRWPAAGPGQPCRLGSSQSCRLSLIPFAMDAKSSMPHLCIQDDRIRTSVPWFPLPPRNGHCKSSDLFPGCNYTTGGDIS